MLFFGIIFGDIIYFTLYEAFMSLLIKSYVKK